MTDSLRPLYILFPAVVGAGAVIAFEALRKMPPGLMPFLAFVVVGMLLYLALDLASDVVKAARKK